MLDPRDRIFALLAISSNAQTLGITPDYSDAVSTTQVFLDTSIRILQHSTNLMILTHAGHWGGSKSLDKTGLPESEQTLLELPSWSLSILREPLPMVLSYICEAHPWKKFSIQPRYIADNRGLILRGRSIEHIAVSTDLTFYCESVLMGVPDEAWVQNTSQYLRCFAEILAHLGPTIEGTACLCRVIVMSPDRKPPPKEPYSVSQNTAYHFWCYFRALVNEVRKLVVTLSWM